MNLMTNVTNYAFLKQKYRGFSTPALHIIVDEVDLVARKGVNVTDLTVDLTLGYEASGCSFTITGEYDPDKTDFRARGAAAALQLGAKVEIALGYIVTEKVFSGLVAEVCYQFDNQDAPEIHVECMDAKCLLMKSQRLEICAEKRISSAVRRLLGQAPVSTYLNGVDVSVAGSDEPLRFTMDSDYDFIVRQAQYIGHEFFIINGKAYFRSEPRVAAPLLTLSPQKGLLSAALSLRGTALSRKVTVVGIDPENDRELHGSASLSGSFGSKASRMIGKSERTYFDPRALSAHAAQDRAEVLLKGLRTQFGLLEASCIGLPELIPGRRVRVEGLMPQAKRTYYVTQVRHVVNSDGFTTNFEARFESL